MNASVEAGVVTLTLQIPAEWGSDRRELGTAFYTAAFDLGTDALKRVIGMDEGQRETARRSTVALESHIVFLGPVPVGAEVVIESRIVDRDAKRIHLGQCMRCDGVLVAKRECLTTGFDLEARRSCAFAPEVRARIDLLYDAQRDLPPHVGTADLLGVARVTRGSVAPSR